MCVCVYIFAEEWADQDRNGELANDFSMQRHVHVYDAVHYKMCGNAQNEVNSNRFQCKNLVCMCANKSTKPIKYNKYQTKETQILCFVFVFVCVGM